MLARRLKPTETLQEYFLAMRHLAYKGSLDESSLIDYVINGIPNSSNNKIILYGYRKNDDHTHDARLDHKHVTQLQPTFYSCGLKGHKSTSCTNKERGKECYGCKNFGHIHANCPKNSTNSMSTSNRNTSTPSDRTVHPISQLSGQISANPMHIPITLTKIQFTALCETGSQATIINDKTYRSIGSPPLYPSYITFSGIDRDKVHSIGFFQDFITIEDTILPAKIHIVSDTSIHLDAIIVMDFLQQTKFTFGKQGIRLCNESTDDTLIAIANVYEDSTSAVSHIINHKIRDIFQNLIDNYKPHKIKDMELKMTILLNDEIPSCSMFT
ncbi:hypothetical protein HNY73_015240 [Argiope bruennichi]|uniref:CCHC-type domain-containing protein n=1 Tax=Argiope bruennichi TaxID=94029 RepID=A0A8T0EVV6_ARGBR|nr:hypothetical protein HNY73_015240 [Argiope bruennichi]